jgi:recombination associated protein RdgC
MFRNLRLYRLASPWPKTEEALSEILSEHAFAPCGAYAERRSGWEAPTGIEDAPLARRVNGADLIQLRTQSRVLPLAAIKEAMEDKVEDYRQRMAQEPPRSELRRLREETKDDLLPKALLKSDRTRGCFIPSDSLLAIDAGTDAAADAFIDHLRICFGSFSCVPLDFRESPGRLLKRIFLGETPAGFRLGRECRMQDASDARSIATWRGFELGEPSIRRHVTEGMNLTHLALEFDNVMTFLLGEDGVVSKLRFEQDEAADRPDSGDPLAKLDADFVLLTGSIERLVSAMKHLLGGYARA